MPRLSPRTHELRALFARSGNRCAFPGRSAVLVNERNQFVGQVCHIHAAEEGGERFNPSQTDEQRRSYANLMLLCYPHHVETNDVALYPADKLVTMKAEHERAFGQKLFRVDESVLEKVLLEMEAYWLRIDKLHTEHVATGDFPMEIDVHADYLKLSDLAYEYVADFEYFQTHLLESDRLRSLADFEESRTERVATGPNDFEILCIGYTNTLTRIRITLAQMEIRYLQEYLKLNPDDLLARSRLSQRKDEFLNHAVSAGYVD